MSFKLPLPAALVLPLLTQPSMRAQTPLPPDPVAQDIRMIQIAQAQGLPAEKLGYLWATLASAYQDQSDFAHAESAYNRSLRLLADLPAAAGNYATALDNMGSLYLTYGRAAEARTFRQKALAVRLQLGDPLPLAYSRQRLAEVSLAEKHFSAAERDASDAYQAMQAHGEFNTSVVISTLITLTYARCMTKNCATGLQNAQEAMRIAQTFSPSESLPVAHAYMALGFAQWRTGAIQTGGTSLEEGLRILRLRLGPSSPVLRAATYEYRDFLKAAHRRPELLAVEQQLQQPAQSLQPCATCTVSVFSLK